MTTQAIFTVAGIVLLLLAAFWPNVQNVVDGPQKGDLYSYALDVEEPLFGYMYVKEVKEDQVLIHDTWIAPGDSTIHHMESWKPVEHLNHHFYQKMDDGKMPEIEEIVPMRLQFFFEDLVPAEPPNGPITL